MTDRAQDDGRNIDTALATLTGEAADQLGMARREEARELAESDGRGASYYGQPLLKESVWGIDIPLYYFVGGAAGAALTLGAAIQLACPGCSEMRELRRLSATCHWIGIIGSTAGAGLLIHDLGRPGRFLHMMRVFRPTSPMNLGAWILAGAAPAAIAAGLCLNRGGLAGRIGEFAGYTAGVFGMGLAGYTGVLVSNSAIPIWQDARRWLPVLFAASAMSTAAGVLQLYPGAARGDGIPLVFGTIGRVAELAAGKMLEGAVGVVPGEGRALNQGAAGWLWNAAKGLTLASLALSLAPVRWPTARRVAGGLAAAGSLCLRLAVHYGGRASARDPQASFAQQRRRLAGGALRDGGFPL